MASARRSHGISRLATRSNDSIAPSSLPSESDVITFSMNEAKIQALMRDVDRSLLRENLKLTPAQRVEKFVSVVRLALELREAGIRSRVEVRAKNTRAR